MTTFYGAIPYFATAMSHRVAAFTIPSYSAVSLTHQRSLSSFTGSSFVCGHTGKGANPVRTWRPAAPPHGTATATATATATVAEEKKRNKGKKPSGKREKKSASSPGLLKALEKYEPVIGVEVHVQLSTKTKAYCRCSTRTARTPNVNICPVCMGHPGALPVINGKVVELAAKAGMALGCSISLDSRFDRKNYYYVDTPKNYQITQDGFPIAAGGSLHLASANNTIGITRLHMEEDSAKMTHEGGDASGRLTDSTHSLIDFNRSGVPLIEIVSEPDIRNGAEAAEYGQELQRVLRYVGTSDCNMQDGSLRCDVNISIREKGCETLGTKVELKNLNSFSSAQKSVDFEIERQAGVLETGGTVVTETRTWDEKANETRTMRVKEGLADYRFFPEPDLPPLRLREAQLKEWRAELPELPVEKRERYERDFGLSTYDAFVLTDDVVVAAYFEETVAADGDPKQAANWIMGDITKVLKTEKMDIKMSKLRAQDLAEMIKLIDGGVINGKVAKDLISELVLDGGSPEQIVEERDLKLISDEAVIRELAEKVIEENPNELKSYKEGKSRLFGFFVGKTLASSGGRADPVAINSVLKQLLDAE